MSCVRRASDPYYYGFLASRTSGALQAYIVAGEVEDRTILAQARAFLESAQQGLNFLGTRCPSEEQLDDLHVVLKVAHQEMVAAGVSTFAALVDYLHCLREPLWRITGGETVEEEDVTRTRNFFRSMAQWMLAEANRCHL